MSKITTHVLDTFLGKPGAGIVVRLERLDGGHWIDVTRTMTDADGRCSDFAQEVNEGRYRVIFETGEYLSRQGRTSLYPEVVITFLCGSDAHYHLPLLLSDNSYTTYRGS